MRSLIFCEVVMSDVAYCLEAVRIENAWHIVVEYLFVSEVVNCEFELMLGKLSGRVGFLKLLFL